MFSNKRYGKKSMVGIHLIGPGDVIILLAATSSIADSALSEALGGPIMECTGSIIWATESDGGQPSEATMRFAVLDDPGANEIALYTDDASFLPEDVWLCSDGFCTSLRMLPSGVTTNVLRLSKATDAGDGKAAYTLSAVFSVISAEDGGLTSAAVTGKGLFACEKPLPDGVVAPGRTKGPARGSQVERALRDA